MFVIYQNAKYSIIGKSETPDDVHLKQIQEVLLNKLDGVMLREIVMTKMVILSLFYPNAVSGHYFHHITMMLDLLTS